MSLADTIAKVRSGVFQIAFANANDEKIGGGSGFLANDFLITNRAYDPVPQSSNQEYPYQKSGAIKPPSLTLWLLRMLAIASS